MKTHHKHFLFMTLSTLLFASWVSSGPAWSASAAKTKLKVYKIDPAKSEFMVNTDTGGFFSGVGHKLNIAIKDFSGEVSFSEEAIEASSLTMKVKAGSFIVTDKIKEKDKKEIEANTQNKVLDSKNYPEITFTSTQVSGKKNEHDIYEIQIKGNLNLHGVTQPITLNGQVFLKDNELVAKGGIGVKQSDFKIKTLSLMGGAFKVKDEVDLTYNIVAHP